MNAHFRLNQTDRLVAYFVSYRWAEQTETGHIFVSEDDPTKTLGLKTEELQNLLATEDATLERGYYEPGSTRCRMDAPVERLQDLNEKVRSRSWRKRLKTPKKFLSPKRKNELVGTNLAVEMPLPQVPCCPGSGAMNGPVTMSER